MHDDGRVEVPGAPLPTTPAPASTHESPGRTSRNRRWMWITVGVVAVIALLLAGTGIGYAMQSGTRADLSAAQTQVAALTDQVGSLQSQVDAAAKASATNSQRAQACQTAMTASNDLTAQWRNLWSDMDALFSATSQSQYNAILAHMNAQYEAMQQAQGSVTTLMETCTGSAA